MELKIKYKKGLNAYMEKARLTRGIEYGYEIKDSSALEGAMKKIQKEHIDKGKESRPGKKLKEVKAIVIHWTGVPKQSWQTVRKWWDDDTNGVYGSAHYIIDMSGNIIECIPSDEVAYHVGSKADQYTDFAKHYFGENVCSNYDSPNNYCIGIEKIPVDSDGNYTDKTENATIGLAVALLKKYGLTTDNLLMHSHIRKIQYKTCPKKEATDPAEWGEFKLKVKERL